MTLIRNSVSENNYFKLVDIVGKNGSEHCNTQWKRLKVKNALYKSWIYIFLQLVGSAPQFPHGSIDSIEEIAAVSTSYPNLENNVNFFYYF